IIALGTQVAASPEPTPEGEMECVETMTVWATWYTAANGGGSGITFTGTAVYKGIVAVDPSVIPLGTEMYIPGYGYGLAADTGGGIIGNWIDLGYGPDDVYDWTTGWVDICILG
ncbi:MAG: 3D domain-containing protein, partial [Dehalococcoidia bacterium]